MKPKVLSEAETRRNIMNIARQLGCEKDVMQIFDKYDKLLRNCNNHMERQAISLAGNEELHFLLSSRPGIILVGNKTIGKE